MQSLEFKNNLSFWTSKYYLSYRQPIANIESLWVKLDRGQYHRWIPKLGDLDLGMISELVRGQNFWPWEKFENCSWGSYTSSFQNMKYMTFSSFPWIHTSPALPTTPPLHSYLFIFLFDRESISTFNVPNVTIVSKSLKSLKKSQNVSILTVMYWKPFHIRYGIKKVWNFVHAQHSYA